MVGVRRVTGINIKLHAEKAQILHASVQKLIAMATWHPEFVHPFCKK